MGVYIGARELLKACGKYGFVFLGVFGSYASGKNTPQSDLDLLVRFSGRQTLLDMVRIEREMSESLGIKIDLLTENSISPYLRDKIKNNVIVIYDNKN